MNIKYRQDRREIIRFHIEFTKIEVEILKAKSHTVSIV
jgi:hypothetical protein